MAALDTTVSPLTGAAGIGVNNAVKVVSRVVDFSATNLASGDWFKLFTLQAGAIVDQVVMDVLTGETGNVTFGITGTLNALSTALSVASTATLVGTVKDYIVLSATPDIVICPDALLNSAVIRVRLQYFSNEGMATTA